MAKKSVTGLMTQQHEVHRLENLFYKKVNSAYYARDYGLDWDFWLDVNTDLNVESFLSYMTQRATRQGIIITELLYTLDNFTLNLNARLLSEEVLLTSGRI